MASSKMKFHRIVFRKAELKGHCWHDLPGWSDVPVDFGWFDNLNESIKTLQEQFKGHRTLRHFAIRENEMYNGLTHKVA